MSTTGSKDQLLRVDLLNQWGGRWVAHPKDGFDLPGGRSFDRRGGKGRRCWFFSRMNWLALDRNRSQNPDPSKPKGSATRKSDTDPSAMMYWSWIIQS